MVCVKIYAPFIFYSLMGTWNQSGLKITNSFFPPSCCSFNQLDLPEYTSKEQLQERLLLAIHEANEGFGFG
jgi:hypothetical protein